MPQCSAHLPGTPIVGTAPREEAYLILELAKPWAKKIKAEGAIEAFRPLLKSDVAEDLKLLATPRIDWLPLCQRPWALLIRWSKGQALVQELDATPEALREMLSVLERKGRVQKLPSGTACGGGCNKCSPSDVEIYEWVQQSDRAAPGTIVIQSVQN